MNLFPAPRLLNAFALWVAATLAVVVAPVLAPVLLIALVALLALCVWDVLLWRREETPVLQRRLPERAFLGRCVTIDLVVRNPNQRPLSIDLRDELPRDLVAADPRRRVTVGAREALTVSYDVCPAARGDRRFGPLWAWVGSPLQFWQHRVSAGSGDVLRVYPDTARYLHGASLDPQKMFQALGAKPAPQRGDGMELESLRDYVPGDDPRRIDWAASARRARPITRLFQHERNHAVIIAVDASRLMAGHIGHQTKLDYSIDASLALAHASLVSTDRVGMAVFDDQLRGFLAPRGQRASFGRLVELVRPLQPRLVEANYAALVRGLAAQQRQRALVVILTDFVEAATAALIEPLVVLARRHRVLLVAVRDRVYREIEPHDPAMLREHTGLYRRIALNDLLEDREVALARMRQSGVQTLDLVPESLRAEVLNRYLAIRYGSEW